MEKIKLSNDIFRNYIMKSIIFNGDIQNVELEEDMHYFFFAEKLKKYLESDDNAEYIIYVSIITVAFLDTYKILNTKLVEGTLTPDEEIIYNNIVGITSVEELQTKIDGSASLLEFLIKQCVEFIRLNDLRKITTIKKLNEAQKHSLKNDFELFKNDLEQYEYRGSIPIDVITDYYKKEMDKMIKKQNAMDPGDRSTNLMYEIMGFIKMLAGNDCECFKELIKDIIILDYKWNKFIIDNDYLVGAILKDEIMDRIEKFEDNSIESLVEDVLYDSYYFNNLIDSIILIKCDNMYIDDRLLTEEMVEDYYLKHVKKGKK